MSLKKLAESRIGKITNNEYDFALRNLNLEIEYMWSSMPSTSIMINIIISNVKFYRIKGGNLFGSKVKRVIRKSTCSSIKSKLGCK